jgi:hypothetical protein
VTSWLRKRFDGEAYVGIELEVNQHQARHNALLAEMRTAIANALREAIAESARR